MTLKVSVQHQFENFALNVSFEAPAGITVLFGKSGSGKTSLINAVAGLVKPQEAKITLGKHVLHDSDRGVFVAPHQRGIGYIFQDHRLFPHLTVEQNLNFGRGRARREKSGHEFELICEMLGLSELLGRRPLALSGGEAQRVTIGRALLSNPKLLLADEPLASLDERRKAEILPYFERIRDELKLPILYVSHAPTEVARLASWVVALERGRVLRQGDPLDILADAELSPAGASAVGAAIEARVAAHHADGLTELSAAGIALFVPRISHALGAVVRVRLPAADVLLARVKPVGLSALNVMEGQVSGIHRSDDAGAIVSLKTGAGTVLSRVTHRSVQALDLHIGARCFAIVKTVAIASGERG
jgi:molybdate transport system ATP-binding protein